VLQGEASAIERFVAAVGPSVLLAVRRILGTHHPDVEDVAQEALFAAIEALRTFRGNCKVLHYVWRVAALTSLNARRRLRLHAQIMRSAVDPDEAVSLERSPMGHVLAARQRQALRRLLDELPAEQSEVLAMHCVLGCTIAETAAATGAPVNTVRGRLVTARSALRRILAENSEFSELLRGVS
jgi:RNA polymerase sigma-70 factor (ECF subfamily)